VMSAKSFGLSGGGANLGEMGVRYGMMGWHSAPSIIAYPALSRMQERISIT